MGNKKDIEALANDILDIHEKIGENINDILNQKENINSKLSYKLDDYAFYNSLIDNCVFYYTKSKDIRFKKLVRDFDDVIKDFNKISYNSKVINNYNFDLLIVENILNAYINCKNYQDSNIRWMKEKHELQDWAVEVKKLLTYHKYLIKSLYDSLICQVNFFTKKKRNNEYDSVTLNIDEMYFCDCKFRDNKNKVVKTTIVDVGCSHKKSTNVDQNVEDDLIDKFNEGNNLDSSNHKQKRGKEKDQKQEESK